jgi:TatD DNase family protein
MILFDFHHHNRENTYGIYNLEPKEIVPEKNFLGIHPKDIDENWEKILKNKRNFASSKLCCDWRMWFRRINFCKRKSSKKVFESKFFGQTKSKTLLLYIVLNDFLKLFHFKK